MADIGTVAGELMATGLAPLLGSLLGWRQAFVVIGFALLGYCLVWILFARSRPDSVATQTGAESEMAASGKASSPAMPPLRFFLCMPVFSVICQHMCFNGSKYFFTSWMPTYFDQRFKMGPERSAPYLSAEKFVGLGASIGWNAAQGALLARGLTGDMSMLLFSRKCFAFLGFGISGLSTLGQYLLYGRNDLAAAPSLTCGLLCMNTAGLMAHGFGHKSNYNDLTAKYSGALMGIGNMLATGMSYVVPLAAAHLMQATGDDWSVLFVGLGALNLVGALVALLATSVERQDARFVVDVAQQADISSTGEKGSASSSAPVTEMRSDSEKPSVRKRHASPAPRKSIVQDDERDPT